MAPLWSVVVIGRNEAKTFPRLVASLKEFRERGGEICYCDTGSTDNSAQVARDLGCVVSEQGTRFVTTISGALAKQINRRFVVGDEKPVVAEGDKLFDYSAARNFAAGLARNDMVSMPDCDEIWTKLDIDKIDKAIQSGVEQFEYNFVFAHDSFGRESVKFLHSKFYCRTKQIWVGVIHEVLSGDCRRQFFDESVLKLEHFQNVDTKRGHYLTGLALDCFEHPEKDRNSHYFARELYWNGRPKSALKEFQRHVAMNRWPAERGESMIYIGECHMVLGDSEKALKCFHNAIQIDGGRRKAWLRMADYFWRKNDAQRTLCYTMAALQIKWDGGFYANDMADYQNRPHEMAYWAYWFIGDREASKAHWKKALEYCPTSFKYLNAAVFYDEIVPSLALLTENIQNGVNFSFVKLGDGEQACMDGKPGQTCDGQSYSPELRQKLREAFDILKDRVYVLENPNQKAVNMLLHRKGNDNRAVADFWKAVRDSKRKKVYVAPARLIKAAELLGATHLCVDEQNAFAGYDRLKFCLSLEAKDGGIFIFSAGPLAKVLIGELVANYPDVTCIDAGSTFDPMFIGQTRTEQLSMQECLALYDETPHLNPTKKWGLKMEVDQFGNRVAEDFYDESEIVCIEAFEKVCLELREYHRGFYNVVELGSCQAYYSLLAKKILDQYCRNLMVEPTVSYRERGIRHFEINGFPYRHSSEKCIGKHWIDGRAEFDTESTTIDGLMREFDFDYVDILHADIDSNERVLLDTQESAFSDRKIKFVFLATHDHFIPGTHEYCKQKMLAWGYTLVLDEPRMIVGSDGLLVFSAKPAITKGN